MITENNNITTNSLAAWILAARPKTLTGAMVPVMIGTAWAWRLGGGEEFRVLPAVLCFLFAFLMQIDSNFINDYFDCIKGNDNRTTRLGPKRACSEGWITLPAMRLGLVITSVMACLVGLPLIFFGGWEMIVVGGVCVLFAFLYTTYFSYLGLGDVLVLVFFGIIPVVFTTYVILPNHSQALCLQVIMSGVICGCVIDTLLVVNNYRDRENDKRDGKITLIVRIGEGKAERLYLALGLVAYLQLFLLLFSGETGSLLTFLFLFILFLPYSVLHYKTAMRMKKIKRGKELNTILAQTARNMLLYGIATAIAIVSM